MELAGKNIGYALTGSFCTFRTTIQEMEKLVKLGANVFPIMSFHSYELDTKFGKAQDFIEEIESLTGHKIIYTIQAAEPIGPKEMFDVLIVAPCSGNTIAKLAYDIIDTPVCMAVKSLLRINRPIVIGISTNNALSGAAENIGKLLNRKNYYFVPFKQDNPITKPRSIVCDFSYVQKTLEYALEGEQISPIIL